MENAVPALSPDAAASVAERTALRALAGRYEVYAGEARRLIDAGFAVMRRTGSIEPRVGDIVREAGLSNQAFYRHFRSKEELLLAVLDDGQRRLVGYLEHRLAGSQPGAERVRRWVEGVMAQARDREAAENTRPFAINAARLADRFPKEAARSRELVLAPLRPAVAAMDGDPRRDADAIYQVAMGSMTDALVHGVTPSRADVEHLVGFALRGIGA